MVSVFPNGLCGRGELEGKEKELVTFHSLPSLHFLKIQVCIVLTILKLKEWYTFYQSCFLFYLTHSLLYNTEIGLQVRINLSIPFRM